MDDVDYLNFFTVCLKIQWRKFLASKYLMRYFYRGDEEQECVTVCMCYSISINLLGSST